MMLNHFVALVSPKMKQKVAAKHLEKAQHKSDDNHVTHPSSTFFVFYKIILLHFEIPTRKLSRPVVFGAKFF